MGSYSVRKLEKQDVEVLRGSWMTAVSSCDELPQSSYERGIAWVEDVQSGAVVTAGVEIYGVFSSDGEIAAVFDFVRVRPGALGSYLKILSIMMGPQLDLSGVQEGDEALVEQMTIESANVSARIVTFGLTMLVEHHLTSKVKIFAGGDATLEMLKGSFNDQLEAALKRIFECKLNTRGNWVEFTRIV